MRYFSSIVISSLFFFSFLQAKEQHDLVNITQVSPNIKLDIRYATSNNFCGEKIYSRACCFLRKKTAHKLACVQQELETLGLGLKVWDGYRPQKAQYKFWEVAPDHRYVADPKIGSKHNRGAAVDCTLIDKNGNELEMPSGFDDFSEKAHRNYTKMSSDAAKNCKLLEDLMSKHGFTYYHNEWWHFNDADWQNYAVLDIPLEEL